MHQCITQKIEEDSDNDFLVVKQDLFQNNRMNLLQKFIKPAEIGHIYALLQKLTSLYLTITPNESLEYAIIKS